MGSSKQCSENRNCNQLCKKALSNLANSLKDTKLFSNIAGYIRPFFTLDSCSGYKLTMRGTLDGNVIVSSDFMFVTCNYAKEGAQYGLNITMLFDMETFTIYELNIDTTYLTDSVTGVKFLFRMNRSCTEEPNTATVIDRSCTMHS